MRRFHSQYRQQYQAIRARQTRKCAKNSGEKPAIGSSGINRTQREHQEQTFRVADVKKVAGGKDEQEPHGPLGQLFRVVKFDEAKQHDRSDQRRQS